MSPTKPAVNWGKQIIWFLFYLFLKLHKRISNDLEYYNINHIKILKIAKGTTDPDLKWLLFSSIDSVCQIFSFILAQSRQIWKRLPAANSRKAFNSCGHGDSNPLLKESSKGSFCTKAVTKAGTIRGFRCLDWWNVNLILKPLYVAAMLNIGGWIDKIRMWIDCFEFSDFRRNHFERGMREIWVWQWAIPTDFILFSNSAIPKV